MPYCKSSRHNTSHVFLIRMFVSVDLGMGDDWNTTLGWAMPSFKIWQVLHVGYALIQHTKINKRATLPGSHARPSLRPAFILRALAVAELTLDGDYVI